MEAKTKFINDLGCLFGKKNLGLSEIIDSLINIINIVDTIKLEAFLYNEGNIPQLPYYKKAFIYKANNTDNYFAIVNLSKKEEDRQPIFACYNLKKQTKCKEIPWSSLNLEYYYALSIENEEVPKKSKVKHSKSRKKKSKPKKKINNRK